MNAVTSSVFTQDYQNRALQLPGADLAWLQALRTQALAQFSATGFPSIREEEWRYTNVSALEKKAFLPAEPAASLISPAWLEAYKLPEAWVAVLVDGRFSSELSNLPDALPGLTFASMTEALNRQPVQVQEYLGRAVDDTEHNFIAFNTAWFSDGLFLHIPAGLVLDKPVQLLHIVTQPDTWAATRNIVIVGAAAELQLIETYAGSESNYLAAAVTEVFTGQQAKLGWYKAQLEGDKAYHFGGTYIKQEPQSQFTHHNFALGSLLARTDIHTDLQTGAECELNGLYLGIKRQHLDNHTRINHAQGHAVSRELYKGVLDERARGVFQGRVIVAEDAQKTDSQMNNRNLLLSADAEVDTKPQLEIYADDVKCAHGVTVGQLDEKSVFYLQSRGVDEETARNMLTFAFANEMVEKIEIKALHEQILEQVLLRFPQLGIDKAWL